MTKFRDSSFSRPDDVQAAANEEFVTARRSDARAVMQSQPPRSGWDPYEVWRTRVRDSRTPLRPEPS